jgi:hypothetical protein
MQFFINSEYESDVRFDFAKFLNFKNNSFCPTTSKFLSELNKLPMYGKYLVTFEEQRPDLLSYKIYGETQYWWILLEYNNLIGYESVETGMTLNYPSLLDLENLYFELKSLQSGVQG